MSQGSIGAGWLNISGPSPVPTAEERAANAAKMREGLPPVRHKVSMRYEKLFDVWRVTFSDGTGTLRECRFEQDHTLEETIRKGRGFTCLADRQAVEMGMRQGGGAVTLHLDEGQYGSLTCPR